MRRSLAAVVGGILVIVLLAPGVAFAAEQGNPAGTYLGTVTGGSGNTLEAWAQVGPLRLWGWSIITVKVADYPSIPFPAKFKWQDPNNAVVEVTLNLPGLVEGSGSAAFQQQGDMWSVTGSGKGSAFGSPEGSGTGEGVRISTQYVEPPLKPAPKKDEKAGAAAGGTKGSGGGSATGGVTQAEVDAARKLQPPADAAGGALVVVRATQTSPPVADGGKVEAGLSAVVAVLVGIVLCLAMGASMSGAEFADMWTAPEGSES